MKIETVDLKPDIRISGYEGEYVFEHIRKHGRFYEAVILDKWISPLSGRLSVIYDIGANIGNHTVYFASKNGAAKIFSFEPMQRNYDLLIKNIRENHLEQVEPFHLALGEERGRVKMRVEKENNNGSATIADAQDDEYAEEVCMDVIDHMELPLPDFVKIDVEGYEVHVLKGMRKTLEHTSAPVWIEVDEQNAEEVYEIMASLGYHVDAYDLQSSNNILFTKTKKASAVLEKNLFVTLLNESAKRRQNWISLGQENSKLRYEQKKAEELKTQLGKERSKLEYEQSVRDELKTELGSEKSKLAYEQKQTENLRSLLHEEQKQVGELTQELAAVRKDLEQKTSQFLFEQKKAEELKKERDELKKKMDLFQNAKLFRFMLWEWKLQSRVKFYIKKWAYRVGHALYMRLLPYPKIRRVFSGINARLGIFKDTGKVISYREEIKRSDFRKTSDSGKKVKKITDFNVAMVVDEFTFNSFKYEFNPFPVEPTNWKQVFEENEIDLFFCESAWVGLDDQRRPWRGQVYGSINFKNENRGVLLDILDYCKQHGIPTVFWNKEDPTHYPDKVHNFVDTAIKFDHIFTTDRGCVERYKRDYGHKSVHLLMFATQPRLFNPLEEFDRTDEIIFAGSWYNQHPVRCQEMGEILDKIVESPYPLKIYDRHSNTDDPNHFFPERFQSYLNPCLSHDKMNIAYKSSKYALNINTVTDSDTMFARRVFELMSSNTLVLSNYSKGMEELFGDNVVFVDGNSTLQLEECDQKRFNNLYNVLQHHTYKQRFRQILQDIQQEFVEDTEDITILYRINNLDMAEKAYANVLSLGYSAKEVVFYVTDACGEEEMRQILERYNGSAIRVLSQIYHERYEKILDIQTKYFVISDGELADGFIERAVCHFDYLEDGVGIIDGKDKFTLKECEASDNIIFRRDQFETVLTGTKQAVKVYSV